MSRRRRRGTFAEESRSCLFDVVGILVLGLIVWLPFATGAVAWFAETLAHSVTFKP